LKEVIRKLTGSNYTQFITFGGEKYWLIDGITGGFNFQGTLGPQGYLAGKASIYKTMIILIQL